VTAEPPTNTNHDASFRHLDAAEFDGTYDTVMPVPAALREAG